MTWASWGGGGATTTQGSSMKVLGGKAFLVGDGESAVVREFDDWGPFRWKNKDGRLGNPRAEVVAGMVQEVGYGTINAQNAAQLLTMIPGMDACEVTEIVFYNFSAAPSATLEGGIYAAEPIGGVNQAGAAILADTTKYDMWAGGLASLPKTPLRAYRKLVGLWWCPKTVSPTALTFDVSIRGMPRWQAL
jgi:hypothetical protein